MFLIFIYLFNNDSPPTPRPLQGLFPNKGLSQWECRVLTTGPPGSSVFGVFKKLFSRQCSPEKLHRFTVPTTYERFSSTSSPTPVLSLIFFFFPSHSDSCVVMSHCGFNIHFSNVLCFIFFCACLPSLYSLGELSLHVFVYFLIEII